MNYSPCPSFPWFWEKKAKENLQKKQGFVIPAEPLKSLEKNGKTLKKNKEILAGEKKKNMEFQKKLGKEGQSCDLDGPAFARIDSQKKNIFITIFITFERLARIASNLCFAIFQPPKARFAKKGFNLGTLRRFAQHLRIDSRESAI